MAVPKADFSCRIFFLLYGGWKLMKKTKVVAIHEIDLFTGRVNDVDVTGL